MISITQNVSGMKKLKGTLSTYCFARSFLCRQAKKCRKVGKQEPENPEQLEQAISKKKMNEKGTQVAIGSKRVKKTSICGLSMSRQLWTG